MEPSFMLNGRKIGTGSPCYVIAEMSANHGGDIDNAMAIIDAAKKAGADCIKTQTYTADKMTIDCGSGRFVVKDGKWKGRKLYDLYAGASMPWSWNSLLMEHARGVGIDFLSTAFDKTAADFLQAAGVNAFKVASFEVTDTPLIHHVASFGKPVFISTGMASYHEIEDALHACRSLGNSSVCLLKCSSSYPADVSELNLKTIPDMARSFGVPVGFSDHSLSGTSAVVAVALGACVVEKHFIADKTRVTEDSSFSMDPDGFKAMVEGIREAEKAAGKVSYGPTASEASSMQFRRSVFVVEDIRAGEKFTEENTRSIRPSDGTLPKYLPSIIGKAAKVDIKRGTPLTWELVSGMADPEHKDMRVGGLPIGMGLMTRFGYEHR